MYYEVDIAPETLYAQATGRLPSWMEPEDNAATFFVRAEWQMPEKKTAVTLSVDDDVLRWFEAQGAEFQHRINAALRIYAEAHQE